MATDPVAESINLRAMLDNYVLDGEGTAAEAAEWLMGRLTRYLKRSVAGMGLVMHTQWTPNAGNLEYATHFPAFTRTIMDFCDDEVVVVKQRGGVWMFDDIPLRKVSAFTEEKGELPTIDTELGVRYQRVRMHLGGTATAVMRRP